MATPRPDGSTTNVTVTDGSVRVTATGDDCPTVIATAGPAITRVGSTVFVGARATDDDSGDQLTYKWSAAAGSFANPTATNTTYTCPGASQAGPQVLTVTVSDGKCSVMRSVTVSCDALVGDAGSGGSRDAGTAETSGGAGGAGGAGGSGAGGVGGSGSGGAAGACAGDDPTRCEGELCNQCTFGVPDGGTDLCDDNPQSCNNCGSGVADCSLLPSDADRIKCQALYVCIRDNDCTRNLNPQYCYCGTADLTACLANATVPPNGPCIKQFNDAAKSTDAKFINAHFVDPTLPMGNAVSLAICRASFCGRNTPNLQATDRPSCPSWQYQSP